MKLNTIASLIVLTALMNCTADKKTIGDASDEQLIFPRGEKGAAANFTGNAYNLGLVPNDSVYNTLVKGKVPLVIFDLSLKGETRLSFSTSRITCHMFRFLVPKNLRERVREARMEIRSRKLISAWDN
jgi:hypothetical protein